MKRYILAITFALLMCTLLTIAQAQDTTLAVTPDGKVGIGTTKPATALHVLQRLATGGAGNAGAITFFPPDGFAWFHIDNGPAGGRPIGRLRISHGVNPGDGEIMSILQNGNVGIGTTNPNTRLEVAGDVRVNGRVTSGAAGVSLPIAYGVIDRDGSVFKGTSNVSSTWNGTYQRYEISISGESYIVWNYVTTVTVLGGDSPFIATTDSVGDKLLVFIFDMSGNKRQESFHFVVFKP